MSEKSREESLSFKEQILRDLEKAKSYDGIRKDSDEFIGANASMSVPKRKVSDEDVMAASLSAVERIMDNAPRVPQESSGELPASPVDESVAKQGVVRPKKIEKEYNEIPTRVAVSYKTDSVEESIASEKSTPTKETVEIVNDKSRRRRLDTAKSFKVKKEKKSHFKAFFISFILFLALLSAGGYFGYQYVQASLGPVDANSKTFVTVQIPEGANVQEIGSTLESSGLVKHGLVFALYAKYKHYDDLKSGYYNLDRKSVV